MVRANRPRDEAAPDLRREPEARNSLESILAVALCGVVIAASTAFLQRSSALSRTLADFHDESLQRPERARQRGWLKGGARPALVILITVDGLRADRLGLSGYARATTPQLGRLAEEALVFRNACAQASQPLTSLKSLLTGKYPSTLLLQQNGDDLVELAAVHEPREYLIGALSAVEGLLARGLRARGYRTAGLTDGPWINRRGGFAGGFDAFDESGGGLAAILPRALSWLETNAATPAFLFLQAADLAHPYGARAPFGAAFCAQHETRCAAADGVDAQSLSDHYDGGVLSVDAHLGEFFEELRRRGLYDRALIVVTAEHGESLGERGRFGHGGLGLEELHVPLVLKFPGDWRLAPRRIEDPVELVDILPTLFSLCGVPAEADLDGRSLLPLILHGVHGRDHLMAETTLREDPAFPPSAAERTLIRPGRWQLIQDPARQVASFFALTRDPAALEARTVPQHELARFLEVLVSRSDRTRRGLSRADPRAELDPELLRELAELGYGPAADVAGEERATALR